ncbi:hypothetical protein FIBSPDRAFT_692339, partial [Athelia psychrophila]
RSLVGIVTSCLATIFACVLSALHPNIPGPNQSWKSKRFDSFKLFAVTLLVPEWVLAWAVRQFLQARKYAKELEAARHEAANRNNTHTWTVMHGFHASMGGFHCYGGEEPRFPLQVEGGLGHSLLTLVESQSLVPPTSGELVDESKGNALSRATAITQTLSFVFQCLMRHSENLVMTNLEIMTLTYIVMTCAMYIAWWYKPYNVRCPIRV